MSETLTGQTFTPTINFNEIPPAGQLLVPGTYVEIAADYTNIGLLPFPTKALLLGQMIASGAQQGSATAGQKYTIYRKDQGVALFGAGSMMADMIAYFLAAKPGVPVDAIGLAAPTGGTYAAGSITFGGTAKVTGTQAIGVCGFRVPFVIQPTDTATLMGTDFVAAVAGVFNAQNIPVTCVNAAGVVTITTNWKGTAGNELDLRVNPAESDFTVPGVTIAVSPMAAGTLTPDITSTLNVIATTWYTDIVCGFTDATTVGLLQAALASRYTAMQSVDSHCYIGWEASQGGLASKISGVNSPYLTVIGMTNTQDPTWRWSSALAGVACRELTRDPARQLRGLALPGIIAPARADRMFEPEQQALLAEGISTWDVAPDGSVILQRVVTTYTQSILGVPDQAYIDIMIPKVMTRIRWDWKNYLLLVAPRAKLSDDGSLAAEYDKSIMTPKRLQGLWAARCRLYEQAGWIENSAKTVAESVFTRDPNDKNRVNSQRKLQIIGNNMVDAEQLLFAA